MSMSAAEPNSANARRPSTSSELSTSTTPNQGKLILRISTLEEENKLLRADVEDLKKWKLGVEAWLFDEFGMVVTNTGARTTESNIKNEDTDPGESNNSSDTHSIPPVDANERVESGFGVRIIKTETEANESNFVPVVDRSGSRDSDTLSEGDTQRFVPSGSERPIPTPVLETKSENNTLRGTEDAQRVTSTSSVVDEPASPVDGLEHDTTLIVSTTGTATSKVAATGSRIQLASNASHSFQQEEVPIVTIDDDDDDEVLEVESGMSHVDNMPSDADDNDNTRSDTDDNTSADTDDHKSSDMDDNTPSTMEDKTPCDVCRDYKPEASNNMVYCEKCNICVHQACYGVKLIPDGDWLCKPCAANIPVAEQKCRFCTTTGGAMIRARSPNKNSWAHVSCTWWIPGPRINNPDLFDCVEGIPKIDRYRYKMRCTVCKDGHQKTCCIQCVYKKCTTAFHVTCAFKSGIRMEMIDDDRANDGVWYLSLCDVHKNADSKPIVATLLRQQQQASTTQRKKPEQSDCSTPQRKKRKTDSD